MATSSPMNVHDCMHALLRSYDPPPLVLLLGLFCSAFRAKSLAAARDRATRSVWPPDAAKAFSPGPHYRGGRGSREWCANRLPRVLTSIAFSRELMVLVSLVILA
jgi:hypothetical protein